MNNIDQELQSTLEISFNESQSLNNSNVNINDIMKNLELADELFSKYSFENECKICYDEKKCIKCGVCELLYCKMCLIRIMTQYQKCSACSNSFDIHMIIKIHQTNKNSNEIQTYQNNTETYNKDYGSSDSDLDKWLDKNNTLKNDIYNLCDANYINPVKRKKKTKNYKCMYDYENQLLCIQSNYKHNKQIILNYKNFDYAEQQKLFIILDQYCDNIELFNKKWNEIEQILKNKNNLNELFLDISKFN